MTLTPFQQAGAVVRSGVDPFGVLPRARESAVATTPAEERERTRDRAWLDRHRDCHGWLLVLVRSALDRIEELEREKFRGFPPSILAIDLRLVVDNHKDGRCPCKSGE